MISLHIRDVAPETVSALKRLARRHHRSLQGELREVLDRAARTALPEEERRPLRIVTVRAGGSSSWRREEIYGPDGR